MKHKLISGLLLFLLWAGLSIGQSMQISDPQAYLQWMLAVTDKTLTPRMAAHLSAAGLSGAEHGPVALILQDFKAEELALEANTSDATTGTFAADQVVLIQSAMAKLKTALSPASLTALDSRVQHEAKNIKVDRSSAAHHHSGLMPVSSGRPQRLGMTPNYTYYNTSALSRVTFPVTASMLFNNCNTPFPQWNASNLVDNDPSTIGFSTNTSTAWNECITIDLGAAQDITRIGLYLSTANYNGQFFIYYQDPGGPWTSVGAAGQGWNPAEAGWNYVTWQDMGAHRYWILNLGNTPGSGPTINELQLIEAGAGFTLYTTSQVTGTTSCPDGCPPLAKHTGWAQIVTPDGTIHNTRGAQVYPTSYINVSDSESTVLPVGGPPSTTTTTGGVDCTVAGNGFSGTPNANTLVETAISRVSWNPSTHATQPYCTPRSSPPDYKGPASVPTSWRDRFTGQGPAGFMDWESIGVLFGGSWNFPQTVGDLSSGKNVAGTYPPVVPDCTNSAAGIFPPVFPF